MGDGVRLAELVAALSLATDLGLGQPQQHIIRQTLIAMRVADLEGLSDDEKAAIFYVSLLAWVGCVADSHEMGKWFGDDMAIRAESYMIDKTGLPFMRFMIGHVADGSPPDPAPHHDRPVLGGRVQGGPAVDGRPLRDLGRPVAATRTRS